MRSMEVRMLFSWIRTSFLTTNRSNGTKIWIRDPSEFYSFLARDLIRSSRMRSLACSLACCDRPSARFESTPNANQLDRIDLGRSKGGKKVQDSTEQNARQTDETRHWNRPTSAERQVQQNSMQLNGNTHISKCKVQSPEPFHCRALGDAGSRRCAKSRPIFSPVDLSIPWDLKALDLSPLLSSPDCNQSTLTETLDCSKV